MAILARVLNLEGFKYLFLPSKASSFLPITEKPLILFAACLPVRKLLNELLFGCWLRTLRMFYREDASLTILPEFTCIIFFFFSLKAGQRIGSHF